MKKLAELQQETNQNEGANNENEEEY